jgi:aryl-alcohol dehydrogenase-like predicted oxidoreductase
MMCRVPHSSGLLEGNLTPDTTFPKWDHRSHRPPEWLPEGLAKVEQLDFLTAGGARTIAQAALKFVLAEPLMISGPAQRVRRGVPRGVRRHERTCLT